MSNTTSCTKKIWIIVFKESSGDRVQRVAAYNLKEILSFYNEVGLLKIVKIEMTEDEITYHY